MPLVPQFKAELKFHFRDHGPERRSWFSFPESLFRPVPMEMEGVEGLNTVGLWVKESAIFRAGDSVIVDCKVIADELYTMVVKPGVRFELWDGLFFASGVVLERNEAGWPKPEKG